MFKKGIVLHAEEVLSNHEIIESLKIITEKSQILMYAWGSHLNEPEHRNNLKQRNVFHGIIYDRIDEQA